MNKASEPERTDTLTKWLLILWIAMVATAAIAAGATACTLKKASAENDRPVLRCIAGCDRLSAAYHDDLRGVTCYTFESKENFSCVPDSQLSPPDGGKDGGER